MSHVKTISVVLVCGLSVYAQGPEMRWQPSSPGCYVDNHQGEPGIPSEIFMDGIIVDSVVFNIALNNKLTADDFILPAQDGEACMLTNDARKFFIRQLENKLNFRLRHPVTGLQLDYRRCIEHQINHLAAVIRQLAPDYQPMILR